MLGSMFPRSFVHKTPAPWKWNANRVFLAFRPNWERKPPKLFDFFEGLLTANPLASVTLRPRSLLEPLWSGSDRECFGRGYWVVHRTSETATWSDFGTTNTNTFQLGPDYMQRKGIQSLVQALIPLPFTPKILCSELALQGCVAGGFLNPFGSYR